MKPMRALSARNLGCHSPLLPHGLREEAQVSLVKWEVKYDFIKHYWKLKASRWKFVIGNEVLKGTDCIAMKMQRESRGVTDLFCAVAKHLAQLIHEESSLLRLSLIVPALSQARCNCGSISPSPPWKLSYCAQKTHFKLTLALFTPVHIIKLCYWWPRWDTASTIFVETLYLPLEKRSKNISVSLILLNDYMNWNPHSCSGSMLYTHLGHSIKETCRKHFGICTVRSAYYLRQSFMIPLVVSYRPVHYI